MALGRECSKVLVRALVREGWEIIRAADTATREVGIDILAADGGQRIAVEVKGYPSEVYTRGPHAGQPKRTRPPTQARHWYASAILTTMLTREAHPDWRIALGLPDFSTYRSLLERTATSLADMGIEVLLVSEAGRVDNFGPVTP